MGHKIDELDRMISSYMTEELGKHRGFNTIDSGIEEYQKHGGEVYNLAMVGCHLVEFEDHGLYKSVDHKVVDREIIETHALYQVPLFFDPHTLLKDFELPTLDQFLEIVGKTKHPDYWLEMHGKLQTKPADWLDSRRLRLLLSMLDLICSRKRNEHIYSKSEYSENNNKKNILRRYTNISSTKFCERVPGGSIGTYGEALALLVALEVIEINPPYSVDKKITRGFRMAQQYDLGAWKHLAVKRGRRLDKRRQTTPTSIETFVQSNIDMLEVDTSRWKTLRKSLNDSPRRIFDVVEGYGRFVTTAKTSRGKYGNRLFHSLTNASKYFRGCLTLDGESIYQIDIAQCQALLFYNDLVSEGMPKNELRKYRALLKKDIYTHLYPQDRDESKRLFSAYAYSGKHRDSELAGKMRELFPKTCELIESRDSVVAKLQRLEARIMIDGVVKQCWKDDLFAIPIHDAILCRESDCEDISDKIASRFRRETSFDCRLETTEIT